jgi:hypothetical protein
VSSTSGTSRRSIALTATLLALLLWLPAQAAGPKVPESNAKVHGDYDVLCRGVINGQIKATVSAKHVHFTGTVKNEAGADVSVNGKVDLEGWRFKGKLDVGGQAVDLNGRVDPQDTGDDGINHARLVCTVKANAGKFGRMAGARVKP